ncbi:hypothetical protein PhCBS80983_g00081 [Powellomyces hirtus]|uniref:FHA domain-containing protein n=1 Tax=Powellomyces hirtus TaxID=109895 RepID=A0A507EGC9_9FUNG|nr:hypothetical protein PhCBS80983_g00081 [Powellomyces hirtus]
MTYSDGKLWVQDTKSSSGTFLNGKRMSPQGQESARLEVHDGDTIRLGEDCEVNGVIHQSVVLKVIFGKAGFRDRLGSHDSSLDLSRYENSENMNDQYVDFSMDPQVQASVDAEFNLIWSSLTQGLDHPLKRLRDFSRAKAAGHTNAIMPRTSVGSSHVLNSYNPRTSHPGSRRPSMSRSDTAIPENEPVTTFDSRSRTTSFTSLSSVGTAHAPLVVTVSQLGHRSISPTLMTALPPDQLPWASPPLASEDM